MCALVRSLPGCWRATRGPGDAGPRGLKWPGTVEGGASPGPPAPALSKRPGHLKDGHGCRHRRSLLLRNERRTWLGQARADHRNSESDPDLCHLVLHSEHSSQQLEVVHFTHVWCTRWNLAVGWLRLFVIQISCVVQWSSRWVGAARRNRPDRACAGQAPATAQRSRPRSPHDLTATPVLLAMEGPLRRMHRFNWGCRFESICSLRPMISAVGVPFIASTIPPGVRPALAASSKARVTTSLPCTHVQWGGNAYMVNTCGRRCPDPSRMAAAMRWE